MAEMSSMLLNRHRLSPHTFLLRYLKAEGWILEYPEASLAAMWKSSLWYRGSYFTGIKRIRQLFAA